jgi:hypothetical protein
MSIYFEDSIIHALQKHPQDSKDALNADVLLLCMTLSECRQQRKDLHRIIRGLLDAAMTGNMKNMLPIIDYAQKTLKAHTLSGRKFDL